MRFGLYMMVIINGAMMRARPNISYFEWGGRSRAAPALLANIAVLGEHARARWARRTLG